jgi:hypothetical protein
MKREHWWLIGGIIIGLMLGGARCSFRSFDSKPGCKPDVQVSTGAKP